MNMVNHALLAAAYYTKKKSKYGDITSFWNGNQFCDGVFRQEVILGISCYFHAPPEAASCVECNWTSVYGLFLVIKMCGKNVNAAKTRRRDIELHWKVKRWQEQHGFALSDCRKQLHIVYACDLQLHRNLSLIIVYIGKRIRCWREGKTMLQAACQANCHV